jgi:hypothetical protein
MTRLSEQQLALQSRGIFLFGTPVFPIVEFVLVPRLPLRVAMAARPPETLVLPPGTVAMALAEVPSLSARAIKARFDLTDYDRRAPSLEFRDPWDDSLLPYATMFRALEYEQQRKAHTVLLDDHPITHKPFLCLRGVREYHEHPQHSGDEWLLYRNEMGLFSIIMSLWRVCVDLSRPILIPQPTGLQVQWNAEEKL